MNDIKDGVWLLVLDTAGETVSVAVTDLSGKITRELICREPHQHTEMLLPLVDDLLRQSGLKLKEAAAVAFSAGPGAFAGVRTACAAAQGLAWAIEKPVVEVSTLAAAALALFKKHPAARRVMPVLDARMHECYVQVFEAPTGDVMPVAVTEPASLVPSNAVQLAQAQGVTVAAGSGVRMYPEAQEALAGAGVFAEDLEITALDIAVAARRRFAAGEVTSAALASPLYVRNRVALTIQERRRGEKLQ